MKIKIISKRMQDDMTAFDQEVNAALAAGWRLTRLDVILPEQPHSDTIYLAPRIYAALFKPTPEVDE